MGKQFFFRSFHALTCEWSGVLDGLFAHTAEAWIFCWVILIAGFAVQQAARTKLCIEFRSFRIVRIFRLLFGIEVIEIAIKLIEAMYCRQVFIAIAKMILADLRGGITASFEQLCNGWVFVLYSL